MDRFLLCENPMTDQSDVVYILHTGKPRTLFKFRIVDLSAQKRPTIPAVMRRYVNTDNVTEVWEITVRQNYDSADEQQLLTGLADRAWHWFRAYLEWEDENIDERTNATNN